MSKFFKKLKEGLEEALGYAEEEVTLKSEFVEIPKPQRIQTLKYGLKPVDTKKT